MFGFSIKLTFSRVLLVILIIVAMVSALFLLGGKRNEIWVQTEQERMEFIAALGYQPMLNGGEMTVVTIPFEFSDVYANYNQLQLQAGFDLARYKGAEVERYTYSLGDFSAEEYVVANLLVKDGKLIGGDISSRRLNGFMLPLKAKEDGQN